MDFRGAGRVIGFLLAAVFVAIIVSSCTQPTSDSTVQTIKWQLDSTGSIYFQTNDPTNYSYRFWIVYPQTSQTAPMAKPVTAVVKKVSGAANIGYGIVFCYQDASDFYVLLIDTQNHYSVIKDTAGNFSTVVPLTTPIKATLNNGVGASNTISVTQISGGTYALSFNGAQETTFSDNSFAGGLAGFYTNVGSSIEENFPTTPEDIQYKMTSPQSLP